MKPIWIVDDDQSIRFVLERALQRERIYGLPPLPPASKQQEL